MSVALSSNRSAVPSIVGHRGACGYAPENTLASIRKAHALGVTWVEFDVKLTSDRQVILFHDDDLDRTSDGTGCVADASLADIRKLDGGSWFSSDFAGEPIPTLIDVITVLADLSLGANIEIKPVEGREAETAEVVCRVIRDHWPEGRALPLISSFKDECLAVACDQLPEYDRALLVLEVPDDWQVRAEALACNAMHVWYEPLTREQVDNMTSACYPVRCYTVNEPDDAKRLMGWGVESIITNYPDIMLELMETG